MDHKDNREESSLVRNSEDVRNYPKVLPYFNLVMVILFLVILVGAAVSFLIRLNIVGVILVGCGFADIISLCIINSIADKKYAPDKINLDELNSVINSALVNANVSVRLIAADVSDAQVIWEMQQIAFAETLEKYSDFDTSPANETFSKVQSRFQDQNTFHYFIMAEDQIVGAVRVVDTKSTEKKRLAQIFVLPEYRHKGYAHTAVKAVEKIHGATGWELDTILQERSLLRFYTRLGYRVKNQFQRINSRMTLVVMEK